MSEHYIARRPNGGDPALIEHEVEEATRIYRASGWVVDGPYVPSEQLRVAVSALVEIWRETDEGYFARGAAAEALKWLGVDPATFQGQ